MILLYVGKLGLTNLVAEYFKTIGYNVKTNVELQGRWNIKWKFDLLIEDGINQSKGVWIRNWKRTVGVNVAVMLDRASEDVGLGRPILVANSFSVSARAYAARRGIELLTFEEILAFKRRSILMSHRQISEYLSKF